LVDFWGVGTQITQILKDFKRISDFSGEARVAPEVRLARGIAAAREARTKRTKGARRYEPTGEPRIARPTKKAAISLLFFVGLAQIK
jgi:hypothetical protein